MSERNGEQSSTAVYERSSGELSVHLAGRALRGLFGDELGAKEWRLPNNDPLRVTRYNSDQSDVFIISYRHNKSHNDQKPIMDNNQRVETSYVIETDGSKSRMACFDDDLIEEGRVEEAIYTLFDQQDKLSKKAFESQLAELAEQRKQVTRDKERLMIATLQTRNEFAATPNEVRDMNNIMRFLNN